VTPDEFVVAIENVVYSATVDGAVADLRDGPPGRDPHPRLRALHEWYDALEAADQRMVAEVVRDAAHAAVFRFLCVLDGVVAIDDPPHEQLRVLAVGADGREIAVNGDASSDDLHDKFNARVHPPSDVWPPNGSTL